LRHARRAPDRNAPLFLATGRGADFATRRGENYRWFAARQCARSALPKLFVCDRKQWWDWRRLLSVAGWLQPSPPTGPTPVELPSLHPWRWPHQRGPYRNDAQSFAG